MAARKAWFDALVEVAPSAATNAENRAYFERVFDASACERLSRSTQDYYSTHGEYIRPLAGLLNETRTERDRALFIAEHLFQMIPVDVWRDHGGDDGQGHYEGDYHAEKVREALAAIRAANSQARPKA